MLEKRENGSGFHCVIDKLQYCFFCCKEIKEIRIDQDLHSLPA